MATSLGAAPSAVCNRLGWSQGSGRRQTKAVSVARTPRTRRHSGKPTLRHFGQCGKLEPRAQKSSVRPLTRVADPPLQTTRDKWATSYTGNITHGRNSIVDCLTTGFTRYVGQLSLSIYNNVMESSEWPHAQTVVEIVYCTECPAERPRRTGLQSVYHL